MTNPVSSCAGWKPVNVLPVTRTFLMLNDLPAAKGIGDHNAQGRALKCWK